MATARTAFAYRLIVANATEATNCPLTGRTVSRSASKTANSVTRVASGRTHAPASQDTNRTTTPTVANRSVASPARTVVAWRRKCATATQATSYWQIPNTFAAPHARTLA